MILLWKKTVYRNSGILCVTKILQKNDQILAFSKADSELETHKNDNNSKNRGHFVDFVDKNPPIRSWIKQFIENNKWLAQPLKEFRLFFLLKIYVIISRFREAKKGVTFRVCLTIRGVTILRLYSILVAISKIVHIIWSAMVFT